MTGLDSYVDCLHLHSLKFFASVSLFLPYSLHPHTTINIVNISIGSRSFLRHLCKASPLHTRALSNCERVSEGCAWGPRKGGQPRASWGSLWASSPSCSPPSACPPALCLSAVLGPAHASFLMTWPCTWTNLHDHDFPLELLSLHSCGSCPHS